MTAEEAVYIMLADDGGGGGGGGKDPLFHYIIENSTNWIDLPIDNKFKYTASLLHTNRTEFYDIRLYPGTPPSTYQDSDGTVVRLPAYLYEAFFLFITAWEYDTPLYSYMASMSMHPPYMYDHVDTTYRFDENGNRVYEYLVDENGDYIRDEHGNLIPNPDYQNAIEKSFYFVDNTKELLSVGFTEGAENFQFVFDNRNVFQHKLVLPASQYVYRETDYEAITYTPETQGKPTLFPTQKYVDKVMDWTYTISYHNQQFPSYPAFYGTYSDFSQQEVTDKYNEIVDALYAARNIDTRNALLDLEIAPNPFEGT